MQRCLPNPPAHAERAANLHRDAPDRSENRRVMKAAM